MAMASIHEQPPGLRVLGKRQSINVRKVLWTCDEIGAVYFREDWGAGTRATSEISFLELNPKALVPVLVDGDLVLTESNTIVRYLVAKHRRYDLLPDGPPARARVEEMMDWQATEFNTAWRVAFQVLVRRNPNAGGPDQLRQSLTDWTAMLQLLDARLARYGPYACGETFTAADIVIGLSVNRWFQSPIERPVLPHVQAYYDLLLLRPAAASHLAGATD